MRRVSVYAIGVLTLMATLAAGCSTTPKSEAKQASLKESAQATLDRFKRTKPGLDQELAQVPAFVVFPNVGKGGFVVGGAYGRGVLYEHGQPTGFADVSAASVGLQAGGQSYAELILLQDQDAVNRFKSNTAQLGASASAVALTAGAQGRAQFNNGMAVYVLTNGGLMAEAAVKGQRFTFAPRETGLTAPGPNNQQEPQPASSR